MDEPKHHEDCMCDNCIKFQELVSEGLAEYESDTTENKIKSLEQQLSQRDTLLAECREWIKKMIEGGEITETFAKGDDFHEAKGALAAFRALDKLLKETK